MTSDAIARSVAVGAITGIRSTAGPAVLAWQRGGPSAAAGVLMALGEMLTDKMPFVGDRTEPLPLTGRLVFAACAGGYVARQGRSSVLGGALLGAGSALITAHLATRARKDLQVPTVAGGLIEDALVMGLSALVAGRVGGGRA
jgi:uncharacterized membrane protein